jgi:uncharacterized membrane protein YdjX (TVP38/TMEM64 family)
MKKVLLVIFIVALSSVIFIYREEFLLFVQNLEQESVTMPFVSALILIGLKAISAPLGFPGTPLTLLAGSLFGNLLGTIIALIGNTIGASLAFLLSRYVLRDYVQKKFESTNPRIKAYDQKIKEKAVTTVIALRLIPLFPFNALNFMLGITSIPFRKYFIGSFIGMIPGTFAFVYFGESLRMLSPLNIALAITGIVLLTYLGKIYEKRF